MLCYIILLCYILFDRCFVELNNIIDNDNFVTLDITEHFLFDLI